MAYKVDYTELSKPHKFNGGILPWVCCSTLLIICAFGYYMTRTMEKIREDVFYPPLPCSPATSSFPKSWTRSGYCPPATNIFFMKTHKCASSTLQNILMRFGDKRNLSFILPKTANYIGYPEPFSKSMIASNSNVIYEYNILCHHLRLSMDAINDAMPEDTIKFTILRDPVDLFQSMYDYYNMAKLLNRSLDAFFSDAKVMNTLIEKRIYNKLGKNQMMFDLGYDEKTWNNVSLVKEAIKQLDEFFDLVMISELFNESLILLKHKFCWNIEDIVYFVHNKRALIPTETHYDNKLNQHINDYNKADRMLYDHFYTKLLKSIKEFGEERMKQEVQELQLWNQVWFNHCIKKASFADKRILPEAKPYNSKVYGFILNKSPIAGICKDLIMSELQYTEKLRSKQKTPL